MIELKWIVLGLIIMVLFLWAAALILAKEIDFHKAKIDKLEAQQKKDREDIAEFVNELIKNQNKKL